jgi:hypothetical protein
MGRHREPSLVAKTTKLFQLVDVGGENEKKCQEKSFCCCSICMNNNID